MLKHRTVRMGLVVLGALVGLSPAMPGAVAATGTDGASTSAYPPISTQDLAAYRDAQLAKQNSAIDVTNATIKAVYEQKVQQLGYEPSITDPREIARQMMQNKYGWGADQFSCYNSIIMRESKWDIYADNPHSSAYGIPQALPGSKMAAFGSDWRTNPATQIRWGLDYVDQRYGTPCQAWSFKRSHGWY